MGNYIRISLQIIAGRVEMYKRILFLILVVFISTAAAKNVANHNVATFSIVAADPEAGEVGIAVASRFFAVGSVVPWADAGVGAVATQAYANTSYGWRGLDMLDMGLTPAEVLTVLVRNDEGSARRQFGIVDSAGNAVTFTGDSCSAWAGGRAGENYAVQGNIMAGKEVLAEMEKAYLNSEGTLAERMYAALMAGEKAGGDSRGKQSAALLVAKDKAGYGGFTDRAIDIRVDDSEEPFKELGRLLNIAQMNYAWNEAWTLFTEGMYQEALPHMERTAQLAPEYPEVLYDLAVIRLAAGDKEGALQALEKSLKLNPKLKAQAKADNDLADLRGNEKFEDLVK